MKTADSVLLTDLYQLTMMQGYYEQGMNDTAVFEFFVRDLPSNRGFLMAAGLEQVVDYLQELEFKGEDLDYLVSSDRFNTDFIDYLADLRFTGDVDAMKEGTVFFANEPILRITAPIAEAQLVESRVINLLQYQTLIASKAVRCVLAAPSKTLVDFGMRRAHGAEAALLAARAAYLAGFDGTSTVLAGARYGVPLFGTMAHSFIEAHEFESKAFENFAYAQPDNVVLLIDTYDTEVAAGKVVQLAPVLAARGINIKAIRLDSGDIAMHARRVRKILDDGGLREIKIFSSGNLDEVHLREWCLSHVPIDGFGIGTRMDTSADAPYLDCAYKLEEYAGLPRRKRSEGKATWPGRKQVHRYYDGNGTMVKDVVTLLDEKRSARVLLLPVMRNGERIEYPFVLDEIRQYAKQELNALPEPLRSLSEYAYDVEISSPLKQLAIQLDLLTH